MMTDFVIAIGEFVATLWVSLGAYEIHLKNAVVWGERSGSDAGDPRMLQTKGRTEDC